MTASGDGAEAYAFNAQIARRRLRSAIVVTVLLVALTFAMEWLK